MLKKERSDIICLQKTHLWATEERFLREWSQGNIYNAAAQVKKRGVCFMLSSRLQWTGQLVYKDRDGQIAILKCTIAGQIWTLIGVYAHNRGRKCKDEVSCV